MSHPKFTLVATNDFYSPYAVMEHIIAFDPADGKEKIASKKVATFKRLDEAFLDLALRSEGPVVIATSAQAIDNVHDLSKG